MTNPASNSLDGGEDTHVFTQEADNTITLFRALFVLQVCSIPFRWAESFSCGWFSWLLLSGFTGNANSVCVPVCLFVCMLLSIYGAGSSAAEAETSFIYMQIMQYEAQLAHPLVCDWMWLALWCIWIRWLCGGGWWEERSSYAKCQRRNHVMVLVNQWFIDPVHSTKWNSWASRGIMRPERQIYAENWRSIIQRWWRSAVAVRPALLLWRDNLRFEILKYSSLWSSIHASILALQKRFGLIVHLKKNKKNP